MKYLQVLTALLLLARGGSAGVVWQIGASDNSTAEFALAPGRYAEYRAPGFFVVGQSEPGRDWPYVQPGVIDGKWAPGRPQTFEVLFGLTTAPAGGGRLVLDLADTHGMDPPKLRVAVNGVASEHVTPKGAGDASVFGNPTAGREHVITVEIPAGRLVAGENRIAITTLTGSWVLWDALRLELDEVPALAPLAPRTVIQAVRTEPALLWSGDREVHPVTLDVFRIGAATAGGVLVDGQRTAVELRPGLQTVNAYRSPVASAHTARVEVVEGSVVVAAGKVELQPVRHWEFHIVNQTHLDIGYTHTQEDVLKLQVEHLRTAMKYIEETRDWPETSKFMFHPEGMWAVEEFMRVRPVEEQAKFVEDCRQRQIHIDSLYAQAMTGMYKEEELFELMTAAKLFERKHGVPVIAAMQSDVPGYTWGLAAALAHHGVPYLSLGPNPGHRTGHTLDWGDRPFWWVDPSGQHKILFWMTGWGYAGFHGDRSLSPKRVFDYIRRLEEKSYPYDMVMWRYSVGGDNGPPDLTLAQRIKAWNERYAWPRLVMARNSEVMETFAKRYGEKLPVVKGDFTPYWEDGAASTAKATGANRQASERMAQAQILWAMRNPQLALQARVDEAWNKMIMYDEHTWGAHCSISRPDDPFSVRQDAYKQAYAFDGAKLSRELLADAAGPAGLAIDVHNTAAWARGGLVVLSREESAAGDRVVDAQGRVVPSQRLASGELAVRVEEVPAFGTARLQVQPGGASAAGSAKAAGRKMENGQVSLEVDPQSGAIHSLKVAGAAGEWVDTTSARGVNDYLYIIGRNAEQGRAGVTGEVRVLVEDAGPLVATLRVESGAPGCAKLTRRIRLVDGLDHVELINTTDKLKERRPEGVYFGFPFALSGAVARVDVPWAVVEVEKDQIPGANRNYYCVQRWVDLSTAERGVTWVTVDAPMLQFEPIKIAGPWGAHFWRTRIEPPAFFWSWAMNNHWETNYKADQEGEITFRYAFRPHAGGYDPVAAQRFGRDICQPLLARPADPARPVEAPLLALQGDPGVVVTLVRPSRDGRAMQVRLFNVAADPQTVRLAWRTPRGRTWVSNPMEDQLKPAGESLTLGRFEIMTLRVENPI